ncbi:MAG TPA: hypothetical protein DEG17_25710 [Cyanobacteria bacterium UBA11149]|nr:hypothetical protein [Cyanobacteria bacterium UBA11367]HBE56894.1 hypothetical protein [Cyanobacteria bacterium UBA11366]HBK66664.1 hypothetical protein [Cyanobacteria bacterium UBA11166]HBR75931.1 hypothetical protein [Cyanobacteria bacterium UBA11159]HBS69699.1 hypothetical protein [Cyanobacteria bacterium UBA11153]HBW92172.1 hypothetical protein [Cyanobacteria bacterium UBA11149]HCA95333.1 hypothetical protein [Cyanobacteria bacterium UBA9226]
MSSFILWNVSFDKKKKELSFFATAIKWLYINQGTEEMIAEMLGDLGLDGVDFDKWTIDHFITDYLSDDPLSHDWKDVWLHTWSIKVHLTESIQLEMKTTHLVRTLARDDNDFDSGLVYFPTKCVLIADFYDSESLVKAKKILAKVKLLREDKANLDIFYSQFPQISEYLLKLLEKEYLEQEIIYETIPEDLLIYERGGQPLQLILTVGTFDEEFFARDAKLAGLISDLVHELGGTTMWHELDEKLCEIKGNQLRGDNQSVQMQM